MPIADKTLLQAELAAKPVPNLRAQTIAKEVDDVCRSLNWLQPEVALEVLQKAYSRQSQRYREKLAKRAKGQ